MTFSIVQLVAVLILGSSSFLSGWMLRRIQAKSREGQLQRELLEIRGSIPSLETNVRNRDQRIATLLGELTEWKTKVPNLESSIRRKDVEVTVKEADLAAMRVEFDALKTKAAASPAPAKPAELESLREALRVAQERGVALAAAVAERDLHLAAATLGMSPDAPPLAQMIDPGIDWNAKVQALEADIAQRNRSIDELQTRLDTEVEQRQNIDAENAGRDSELERLRAEVNKWQARVPKLVATIKARDATVAAHAAELAAHHATIAERDTVIAERESIIAARDFALAGRDSDVTKGAAEITQRDAEIAARAAQLNERDAHIATLAVLLAERDAALAQLEVDRSAAQTELDRQRTANDAANTSLEQRMSERSSLSLQLNAATVQNASLAAALDERAGAITILEQRNTTLMQEFDAASQREAMKLSTALRLGREEIDNHLNTLSVVTAERDTHAARAAAVETERAALERQLVASTEQLRDQERSAQTLQETLAAVESRLAENDAAVAGAVALRTALEQQLTTLRQQQGRVEADVELKLRSLERDLLQREEQLVLASEQRVRHEQDFAGQQSAHAAAMQRIDDMQRARSALEAQLADATAEHEVAQAEFAQRIASLQAQQGALEQTSDAAQHLRDTEREKNALIVEDFKEQTAELALLHEEVRGLHTRIAPLESLLKQRDGALSERAARIEALTTQLQVLTTQNESLQTTLRQRGERIATLERKFSDQPPAPSEPIDRRGEHLEQRLVAQTDKNRELTRTIEEREHDLVVAAKKNDLNEKSLLVLKQQLDDARTTEERLAGQVRDLKGAAQRSPAPDAAADKVPMGRPNGLFELPPEHIDELQQIRGIGAGFERGLNKLGIYQFTQLAGLGAEEIAWIEAHLPTFHGRVERDDWPGQAAALIASSEHAEWSLRARADDPSHAPRVN